MTERTYVVLFTKFLGKRRAHDLATNVGRSSEVSLSALATWRANIYDNSSTFRFIHPSNLIHLESHSSIISSMPSIILSIAYQHWTSCCKYLERRNYTLALTSYPLDPSATLLSSATPRSISESLVTQKPCYSTPFMPSWTSKSFYWSMSTLDPFSTSWTLYKVDHVYCIQLHFDV